MIKKSYNTPYGIISYYINIIDIDQVTLVLLPGLTADHHLFDKQVGKFEYKYNLFTWDAPGHAASRPFDLKFNLEDKAEWLHDILEREQIRRPILIGQSMGGYVSQMFMQKFPGYAAGFISIDSAPLKRYYMTKIEIWMLKNCEIIYKLYPWKALLRDGARGCSTTRYGQKLMARMMKQYEKMEYCRLVGHGYRMLAEAVEANYPYEIACPALLICGEKDIAGSTKSYNKRWAMNSGIPIIWIKGAGHNSNTDQAMVVNSVIKKFANCLEQIRDLYH